MSYSSFASVYDELTQNVDYKKRAEYIASILADFDIKDGLLLDLACGTGSLSVEFSKMGFEVIGTDASPDMLMEAREKAMEDGENILFLCQKMQETDLYGTVRAIVCSLDSINHLSNADEMRKTFRVLKNFIDDGGIMIFDVNTIYKHQEILGNNTFIYDEKNVYCVWQNSLYPDGVTVGINCTVFPTSTLAVVLSNVTPVTATVGVSGSCVVVNASIHAFVLLKVYSSYFQPFMSSHFEPSVEM